MPKAIYTLPGTKLDRFLKAILCKTMSLHPEFIQSVGHAGLLALADELRTLGWNVKAAVQNGLINGSPSQRVAFIYINEYALAAATGEDFYG